MNNYEKLCKAVGVKLIYKCEHLLQNKYCDENKLCRDTFFEPFPRCEKENCTKKYKKIGLAEDEDINNFTAEKQIETIKLISHRILIINHQEHFSCEINSMFSYGWKSADFSEALAGLALQLIKAGELNKEKVKKILE